MRDVRLEHNPFTEICNVYLNGVKYDTSSISAYLCRPFAEWGHKIIAGISDEVNGDDYSFTYVGLESFGRLLKYYAHRDPCCTGGVSIVKPTLGDSIKSRLGKLNLLCQNGLELPRVTKQIPRVLTII